MATWWQQNRGPHTSWNPHISLSFTAWGVRAGMGHWTISLSLTASEGTSAFLCQPGSGRERHATPNGGHWRTDLTKEQVTKVWAAVWETNQGPGRALELAIVASHSMCSPEGQGEGTVPRAWRGPQQALWPSLEGCSQPAAALQGGSRHRRT